MSNKYLEWLKNNTKITKKSLLRVLAMVTVASMLVVDTNLADAKNIYTITEDTDQYVVEQEQETDDEGSVVEIDDNDVDSALDEAGVPISATDTVNVDTTTDEETGNTLVNIEVEHAAYATITVDKSVSTVQIGENETVQSVLDRLHLTLGKDDIISKDVNDIVVNGDNIVINRVEISHFKKVKTSKYDTTRVADPHSYIGEEYVKVAGVPGKVTYTYEKKIIDGGEPIITLVKTKTEDMVTEVIAYGTHVYNDYVGAMSVTNNVLTNIDKSQGTVTMADGSTYGYSSVKTFTATAYSVHGRTASGRRSQVGVVAVDPSVIPLGTLMYIAAGSAIYGVCVAGDTGVKGHTVDLFFNSESQCIQFGRRECTIYFLY